MNAFFVELKYVNDRPSLMDYHTNIWRERIFPWKISLKLLLHIISIIFQACNWNEKRCPNVRFLIFFILNYLFGTFCDLNFLPQIYLSHLFQNISTLYNSVLFSTQVFNNKIEFVFQVFKTDIANIHIFKIIFFFLHTNMFERLRERKRRTLFKNVFISCWVLKIVHIK